MLYLLFFGDNGLFLNNSYDYNLSYHPNDWVMNWVPWLHWLILEFHCFIVWKLFKICTRWHCQFNIEKNTVIRFRCTLQVKCRNNREMKKNIEKPKTKIAICLLFFCDDTLLFWCHYWHKDRTNSLSCFWQGVCLRISNRTSVYLSDWA